ncbi:MAG TPA: hypothetical protein PLN52_04320 [Opitutaceae bacterium]|nr:hypothetical protein [Opitutaceae bacterium]
MKSTIISILAAVAALLASSTCWAQAVPTEKLSRNAADPVKRLVRYEGTFYIELEPFAITGESIQWMRNGVALPGKMGPALSLTAFTVNDSDLYYAIIKSSAGAESRSQSVLVIAHPKGRLLNASLRGSVAPLKPLIAGFVIKGDEGLFLSKKVLIRIVGPSLRQFGLTQIIEQPLGTVYKGVSIEPAVVKLDPNSPAAVDVQGKVGAFSLIPHSQEYVGVAELPAGNYTVHANGSGSETGEVLIEIYEVGL